MQPAGDAGFHDDVDDIDDDDDDDGDPSIGNCSRLEILVFMTMQSPLRRDSPSEWSCLVLKRVSHMDVITGQ